MISKETLEQFCIHYNVRHDPRSRKLTFDWVKRLNTLPQFNDINRMAMVCNDVRTEIYRFNSNRSDTKINEADIPMLASLIAKAFKIKGSE